MKLALSYTIFGTELLNQSIANIIDLVDVVLICYQETSNTGNFKPFLWSHHYNPKIKLVKYEPNLSVNTKVNERLKHQLMIDTAKQLECTHFLLSATDHFYKKDEFLKAREIAVYQDVTFTAMYTYFKHPTWQITPIEDYYMPFICKLGPRTRISNQVKYPLRVDPSVRIEPYTKWYLFKENEIMLHHFSMVRKDMKAKFENAASSIGRNNPEYLEEWERYDIEANPGIQYFKGRKVKIVDNYFNL